MEASSLLLRHSVESQLDSDRVRRAISALIQYIDRNKSQSKNLLEDSAEWIQLVPSPFLLPLTPLLVRPIQEHTSSISKIPSPNVKSFSSYMMTKMLIVSCQRPFGTVKILEFV